MSRKSEVLDIANQIAKQRGNDVVPAKNLWLRCGKAKISQAELKAAVEEAIEHRQLRKTQDGQLLLIRD